MHGIKEMDVRTFEHKWMIEDRDEVRAIKAKGHAQTLFHLRLEDVYYGTFLVKVSFRKGYSCCFEWTLYSKNHCLDYVGAHLVAEVLRSDGTTHRHEVQADPLIIMTSYSSKTSLDEPLLNPGTSFEINLRCTLNVISSSEIEKFRTTCKDELCINLELVLEDKQNSDVKIITKDNTELFAHRNILQARCPLFASMFGSGFLESSTGLVNVDDISAKTMKILLHYWYTGTLLPSWMEDDTLLEFVYAAGKYQMMPVLKMLNDFLGRDPSVSELDVELLKTTHQLSMKSAEARILKRIINKISNAKSGTEILEVFSIPTEKFDETKFTASQIFEACNEDIRENDDAVANHQDIKLMGLASSFGMRNVETNILKRVVWTVNQMDGAEELLALFNLQK